MRQIRHAGAPAADRMTVVPCRAERTMLTLSPGRSVNHAAAEAFAGSGAKGGYLRLRDAPASPMRYVIPAVSPDDAHVAWYSETFAPEGTTVIEDAGLVVGWRDGMPFLHCHGLWRTPDGERRMGHLLPLEAELAMPVEAEAWLVSGASFEVRDDEETNFRLFRPVADGDAAGRGRRALACAVRPNEDVGAALEEASRLHGLDNASVHGIGSLIGADFEDGSHFASFATEVLILEGTIRGGRCTLDVAMVGLDGSIAQGRLARGRNPVCVTFEVLVVSEETT